MLRLHFKPLSNRTILKVTQSAWSTPNANCCHRTSVRVIKAVICWPRTPLYRIPWHPLPAHVLNQAASIDVINSCPDPSPAWPVLSLRGNGFPALALLSERHLVALKKLQWSQDYLAESGRWRVWSTLRKLPQD